MRRQEQREWLVRLVYAQDMNSDDAFDAKRLLREQALPEDNAYLQDSLNLLHLHQEQVDHIIEAYLHDWTTERLHAVDRAILRVAVNEILFTDFAPIVVTIHECVGIAKRYSDAEAYKFINGVLSSLLKDMRQGLLSKRFGIEIHPQKIAEASSSSDTEQ
ncbi:transcription antitermination factor NusB [Murdochiella vaginalis]|uniref:transcription antitermination factor NusB n=1 Tax=Murdochiella vaginalis TaxID=1852373 RepID=UPI0012FF4011|nr:transcription antitermination factor NusB [Murdochiella vaginalis]